MYGYLIALIKKDVSLELKRPYLFNGMLLYLVSTVFVCYLAFEGLMDKTTWNALYWIILLFASVNTAGRSFSDEFSHRHLYYYSISSPAAIILSKMFYNAILMLILANLGLLAFTLFLGAPSMDVLMFVLIASLGSISIALLVSLVAGIAARAEQNFTLMAILSFPIVLPKLIILISLTNNALNQANWMEALKPLLALLGLKIMIIVLALVLFPYIWKD